VGSFQRQKTLQLYAASYAADRKKSSRSRGRYRRDSSRFLNMTREREERSFEIRLPLDIFNRFRNQTDNQLLRTALKRLSRATRFFEHQPQFRLGGQ